MLDSERVRREVDKLDEKHKRVLELRCAGNSVKRVEQITEREGEKIPTGTVYAYQKNIVVACGADNIKEVCAEMARQAGTTPVEISDDNEEEDERPPPPPVREPDDRPVPWLTYFLLGLALIFLILIGYNIYRVREELGRLPQTFAELMGTGEEPVEEEETQTEEVHTLEDVELISGRYTQKPDTVVYGEPHPDAVYLEEERIVVRLLERYSQLRMKVGVDDTAGTVGTKRFWIRDQDGNLLKEGVAMPNRRPIIIDVNISDASTIEVTNYDLNGQTPEFIRWFDIEFIPKP